MLLLPFIRPKKTISKELIKFLFDSELECIYDDLRNSENGNDYFDFSTTDKSKISYLKGDRIPEDESLLFDDEYRKNKAYHTKIGKLLSDKIKQGDIQRISALLYNRAFEDGKNLFLTKEIKRYYLGENYSDNFGGGGQLHSSCMKGEIFQDAIGLYEKIGSDIVELLVLTDENDKVLTRGLFWKNVKINENECKYLDRVYAVNDNISHILYDYAKNKGILSYNDNSGTMKINVNINENDAVPYFDTFKYYTYGQLSTSYGDYNLEGTDGGTLEELNEDREYCGQCENSFNTEDGGGYSEYLGEYICGDCGIYCNDSYYPADECICVNDEYYHQDDEDIITVDGEYYLKDDENICYSEYNGEYLLLDDAVYSEYHDDYFPCDDVVFIEEKEDYYLTDDENIFYNKETSEYELKEEETINA